jgi:hypothetical protein
MLLVWIGLVDATTIHTQILNIEVQSSYHRILYNFRYAMRERLNGELLPYTSATPNVTQTCV